MFVVQYWDSQGEIWLDDPFFKKKETLEDLENHFRDETSKVGASLKDVTYRIVKREEVDTGVALVLRGRIGDNRHTKEKNKFYIDPMRLFSDTISSRYSEKDFEDWYKQAFDPPEKHEQFEVKHLLGEIGKQRELILAAFVAETGLNPSECIQVQQCDDHGNVEWYVRRRTNPVMKKKLLNWLDIYVIEGVKALAHPDTKERQKTKAILLEDLKRIKKWVEGL